MEISSSFNVCPQKPKSVSFGQKYPYGDIMAIMSGSYLRGGQKSVENTIAGILHKTVSDLPAERCQDETMVRNMLRAQHPDLIPFSESFRNALNDISLNHFAITIDDVQLISERESQKYGSKFVDVV
jgi:hypothetical protein